MDDKRDKYIDMNSDGATEGVDSDLTERYPRYDDQDWMIRQRDVWTARFRNERVYSVLVKAPKTSMSLSHLRALSRNCSL